MRRTPFFAALVATLGVGCALVVPSSAATSGAAANNHVRRAAVSAKVAAALGPGGELRSAVINDVSSLHPLSLAPLNFSRMAADGLTSVTAYIYLYVQNPSSADVFTGSLTPSDSVLADVTAKAKAAGLAMHWMPILLDKDTNTFRGRYQPADPKAFFASYTTILNHYADLAQSNGVTLFFVGSENDYISRYTISWDALIASVRKHYRGALSYMSTGYAGSAVHYWDKLDLAAVSPYYSLGTEKVITYDRVMSAWNNDHLPYLAQLAKTIKKPLIFGEIGYQSHTLGYASPATAGGLLPAPSAQERAYHAILDAIAKSPYVYGMTIWAWNASSPLDTGYSPEGKPAECTLALRWSTDAQTLKDATLPTCDLSSVDTVTELPGL